MSRPLYWASDEELQGMKETRQIQIGYLDGDTSQAAVDVHQMYLNDIKKIDDEAAYRERLKSLGRSV